MDDELSARARRLVEVAMEQDVPPAVVVEDSWGMVISRVTADTDRAKDSPPLPENAGTPRRASRRTALISMIAVIALALLAANLFARPSEPDTAAPVAARPPVRPARAAPPDRKATAVEPSAAGLLDEAEAAVATEPIRSLDLVDRHAALAPTVEAERRMALRIVVLCALGRDDEARAEATAFSSSPRAPQWTARVRESCAGEPQ